jgi:serine/threonine protein kinase
MARLGFLLGLLAIGGTARAFTIEEYDINIANALKGEFTIMSTLQNGVDFGTEDKKLNRVLKALYKRFGEDGFEAFLSARDNSFESYGYRVTSGGVRGEGGFGKVFALSAETKAGVCAIKNGKKSRFDIAVKMLKTLPTKNSEKYELEVELNNMKFLATLKSTAGFPFAVPYYGAFIDKGGRAFILTQLMNESLSDYTTAEKVLHDADIDMLITALGEGSAKWQELGFVHNDIKPDNIMRDINGNFYFIDFGTTRRLGPTEMRDGKTHVDKLKGKVGKLMANIGTPAMKSPEKILDNRAVLGPLNWGDSDVYSFGMTLWAVLARQSEGALLQRCVARGMCPERFQRGDMREEDFNGFREFVRENLPVGLEPRAIKAAKRLVGRLLTWRPSDRPSDVLSAYREELR